MPNRDDGNFCTPLQDLKSVLELLPADRLHDQPRHGNASINPIVLAMTAFVTFRWTKQNLERAKLASLAKRRSDKRVATFQAIYRIEWRRKRILQANDDFRKNLNSVSFQ